MDKKGKKSKKSQKRIQSSEEEDNVQIDKAKDNEGEDTHIEENVKKEKKKNKKKQINIEKKKEESESDEEIPVKSVEVEKKVTKKPNMAALYAMLGDEDESDVGEKEEEEEEKKVVEKKNTNNQQTQKKQKGKNKQQKKKEEEEDFDAILSQFSDVKIPPKINDKKQKKGKKDTVEDGEEKEKAVDKEPNKEQESGKFELKTDDDISKMLDQMDLEYEEEEEKKKKKKKKDGDSKDAKKTDDAVANKENDQVIDDKKNEDDEGEDGGDDNDTGGGIKTAAQKRKEKKERQKLEKIKEKKSEPKKEEVEVADADIDEDKRDDDKDEDDEEVDKDKKKNKKDRKKKGEKKEEKPKKNKMGSMIKEAQLLLKQKQEEAKRLEEERIRKEEEEERLKEEKERLEREKKERKKQKEKEKIQRLKAEGKFLTEKQKEDRRRAMELLESIQGITGAKPQPQEQTVKKVVYSSKPKKRGSQKKTDVTATTPTTPADEVKELVGKDEEKKKEEEVEVQKKDEEEVKKQDEEEEDEDGGVKDNWDESSEDEEEEEEEEVKPAVKTTLVTNGDSKKKETNGDDDDDDDDDTVEEKHEELGRDKALARIKKRKEDAEAAKSFEHLRAPIICVLGHVDTGKTKILDKLRHTHVQDGEAGGITQQIGATNVPQQAIRDQTKMIKDFELKLPGLLFIDTPGHESFSNLRTRGSSLCDIAILIVDIMHGLEPQTIESIQILKARKTPFIVALNKIDRLFNWVTNPHTDIVNLLKKQKPNTKLEFDERVSQVIVQFAEQGLNARLFYENKNQKEFLSLVPTSAMTGDGMGNLIALLCELVQNMLVKRLQFSNQLQATVMEVKMTPGHGATLDVILVNGSLKTGQTIVVAGQDGPITTQIRSLLLPHSMQELRVKSQFQQEKEVKGAKGCKVAAKDLERALPGLPLHVAHFPDEVDIYKEELSEMLKDVLSDVKLSEKGVFVQASTLGSLEALLTFLKSSDIPYAGINIGPVHKKDITKASVMLEQDPRYAVILAFDVKIEREAQEMADREGIRIFSADIIYHLFDQFTAYREDYKKQKQLEYKSIAMFPCKLRILPDCVFKTRDPIVMGVHVEGGFVKEGTVLCVPSKDFIDLGRVSSIENNHKMVEKATVGQEVCIKIDNIPGEAPKLYGRHFDQNDLLVSKISRASIDALKNWFREDMSKADWQLIVELKKTFEIL